MLIDTMLLPQVFRALFEFLYTDDSVDVIMYPYKGQGENGFTFETNHKGTRAVTVTQSASGDSLCLYRHVGVGINGLKDLSWEELDDLGLYYTYMEIHNAVGDAFDWLCLPLNHARFDY